jgi:osmotically-inducible protein OsmY
MAEVAEQTRIHRPAEDIAADIAALIRSYHPLRQSRHWFTYTVVDGVVTLHGNVKPAVAQRVLLDNLPHIPGVEAVNADDLHSDEQIRIAVGQIVPPGVLVHVDFGRVALDGALPPRRKAEPLIKKIEKVPGVREVESFLP